VTGLADTILYHLLIDVQHGQAIYVFLGRGPRKDAEAPPTQPVHLELLPAPERFGRPGRSVLGQAGGSRTRFREFATSEELWEAGFLPVASYRVCDTWEDYHFPWRTPTATDQPTDDRCDESV
jgi:hypothetical protein